MAKRERGRLSVVATPIGNLEDITLRALRVLRECDAILAEDTRRTRALCTHHGVATPLRSFHAHTPDDKVIAIADELAEGAHYSLVTDAGTPLVSDPGARLVAAAAERGVAVEPIPGPSAVLAALSAAGLHVHAFRFVGFLPRSGKKRARALEAIARAGEATVLFEAPTRLPSTLRDLAAAAGGDRRAAVCRELTKVHEEVARGSLAELCARYAEPPRGEVTIVVEGAPEEEGELEGADPEELARALLARGLRTKEAARRFAELSGTTMREAYAVVLAVAGRGERRGS
ncbi:MAG TPA: 16S rRNA (cytidine(1402)-2'-O)-methyltransferase [Sandaracinaceae bacterium]